MAMDLGALGKKKSMSNLGFIHLDNIQSMNSCLIDNYKFLESFTHDVAWSVDNVVCQNYKEKVKFLNNNSGYIFDIDVKDRIFPGYLLELFDTKLVKLLTATECDYCAISDQLIDTGNLNKIFDQKLTKKEILIFTHGRSGTNLLKSSLNKQLNVANDYLHNNIVDDFKNTINILSQYQEIVTVVRKDFFEYLSSLSIASHYSIYLNTKKDNVDQVQKKISTFSPFEINQLHADHALKQFYTFCDIIAYLKHLGVKIYYIFYEDLVKVSNTQEVLKNPYRKEDLIINFDCLPEIFYNHNRYYMQILTKVLSKLNYLPAEYLK